MRIRLVVLLLASALLVAGCADQLQEIGEDLVPGDGATPSPGTSQAPQATPAPDGTGGTSGAGGTSGPGTAASSEDQDGGDTSAGRSQPTGAAGSPEATGIPINDLAAVGHNGQAILDAGVPELIVEVDVQEGVAAGEAALDELTTTLGRHAHKDRITLAGGNRFASQRTRWTPEHLRAAAEANRRHYSDADTVVVYVLYVDGSLYRDGGETNAIGVAYNASELALFPAKWQGIGSLLGGDAAVERAVIVHELGHLLGLVNLTYASPVDHEDPQHPGHSANQGSVMYYAIESTVVAQIFNGPPPHDFDDADRADIDLIRSGAAS